MPPNRITDNQRIIFVYIFGQVFYLATKGGGEFFSEINGGVPAGTFENGGKFSAVVIDDMAVSCPEELTAAERLQRAAYLGADISGIKAKYADGEKISGVLQ